MSVTSGYNKYKRYQKLSDGTYKLVSQWTSSNTVHFDDGNTAQTKVGAISGITDSLTATSSNVALSAAGGNNLQTQIDEVNSNLENNYIAVKNPTNNDSNTIMKAGVYAYANWVNTPSKYGVLFVCSKNDDINTYVTQEFTDIVSGNVYRRFSNDKTSWSSWKQLAFVN